MPYEPPRHDLRGSPLFRLFYRNIRRLLRNAPSPLGQRGGPCNERVRAFMARQIARRVGLSEDDLPGTLGYTAACEGHNASVARDRRHYAELCAEDTVEQVYRMRNLGMSMDAESEDADDDERLDQRGGPSAEDYPRAYVLARRASQDRERREQQVLKSGLSALTNRPKRRRSRGGGH